MDTDDDIWLESLGGSQELAISVPLTGIKDWEIREIDIVLGSGWPQDHPGNVHYLGMLQAHESHYFYLETALHREQMALQLVLMFRKEKRRFLAKKRGESEWYDIGNEEMSKEISQWLKGRLPILQKELLEKKKIEFTVVTGDICKFQADVVAMKHAQDFCGVDAVVVNALEKVGIMRHEFDCPPYCYRLKNTKGGIMARDVLYVGMPHYLVWDHYQVQEFARRSVEILQTEAPHTKHLALTLHGPNMGLDEIESFLAEIRGLLTAMHLGTIPVGLEQITLVEMDHDRVGRLRSTLEFVLSEVAYAEPTEHDWGYRLSPSKVPSPSDPLQQIHSLKTTIPKPAVPASKWCISYDQLMDLEEKLSAFYGANYHNKTMRDICEDIIKKSCSRTGSSYALYLNPSGLAIDTFVSHSWDGRFQAFVQSIRSAYQTSMTKPNLWICAFALVQAHGPEVSSNIISQQLGSCEESLETSPFVLAIKEASSFCVVRNSRKDIYRRIWCVCELMYAEKFGLLPSKTNVTGPDTFACESRTSVLEAEATKIDDKERILRVLLNEFNRAKIDEIVHQLRTQAGPVDLEL